MFAFNFNNQISNEDNNVIKKNDISELKWFAAKEIKFESKNLIKEFEKENFFEIEIFQDLFLKIMRPDKVAITLKQGNHENILEAESQHSDLIPAKYEGGIKIWECTYDLSNYILRNKLLSKKEKVLDLGCGTGVIGIIAFLHECIAHFQDYNTEVIESVTIPNVIANCTESNLVTKNCKFYSGDWKSFVDLTTDDQENNYDYIFTCETIYNPENYLKLYEVFKKKLKIDGIGLIAGKTHYFGVGGNMRQFEELIIKDGIFDVQCVWKSNEGLQREIIEIKRKPAII